MRILISTPLYPPETAYPAVFSRKLASYLRLSKTEKYLVTVLAFSDFPEKVENVKIIYVSKRQNLILRLIKYFIKLIRNTSLYDY